MADTPTLADPTGPSESEIKLGSNFLDATGIASETIQAKDVLYNDFFQENSNGEITIGSKKERSGLEIVVSVMQYITIFIVTV